MISGFVGVTWGLALSEEFGTRCSGFDLPCLTRLRAASCLLEGSLPFKRRHFRLNSASLTYGSCLSLGLSDGIRTWNVSRGCSTSSELSPDPLPKAEPAQSLAATYFC
jgi:hypothetical protein